MGAVITDDGAVMSDMSLMMSIHFMKQTFVNEAVKSRIIVLILCTRELTTFVLRVTEGNEE